MKKKKQHFFENHISQREKSLPGAIQFLAEMSRRVLEKNDRWTFLLKNETELTCSDEEKINFAVVKRIRSEKPCLPHFQNLNDGKKSNWNQIDTMGKSEG